MNIEKENISILVPIFNRIKITKKGLKSLFAALQNYKNTSSCLTNYEIIVIDDGSTDGSCEWISANYPSVHMLKGDGNLWWSGAINTGIDYSITKLNADFIIWWNNDIIIKNDYFIKIDLILNSYRDTIIASKVYYQDRPNKIFYYGATFNKRNGNKKITFGGFEEREELLQIQESDWTGGMGVIFPSSVFKENGYIDNKNFPQYYGDCDFTLKAKDVGYKIICHPELKVWNDRTTTSPLYGSSFIQYFKGLFMLRSNYNILKDFKFYKRHTGLLIALYSVILKHAKIILKILFRKIKIIAVIE